MAERDFSEFVTDDVIAAANWPGYEAPVGRMLLRVLPLIVPMIESRVGYTHGLEQVIRGLESQLEGAAFRLEALEEALAEAEKQAPGEENPLGRGYLMGLRAAHGLVTYD